MRRRAMKVKRMAIMIVAIAWLCVGCASKPVSPESVNAEDLQAPTRGESTDLPEPVSADQADALPKEYQVAGTNAEFKIVDISDSQDSITARNLVAFKVPILKVQLAEEGLTNPDWQVSASYAWTDGLRWNLFSQPHYRIESSQSGGEIEAKMSFPDAGQGWYWVRVWAFDKNSGNWLWINQDSQFCREDLQGDPGYEFLVNPSLDEVRPVSSDYQVRP